ncbi:MAG: conjugal transfer protein TraX [Lachnospiraceae bacterium]|nr:conjugal transfer protein TraX [Lachnospiraceae bacterium]
MGQKGISGSTIKMIAIISMFIDHVGAVVVERMLYFPQQGKRLWTLYMILRSIGRLGFPIFCFLLVTGFMHTRNVWKYALRLGLFALLSEVPFDLAFSDSWMYMGYQNVFFTLLIGLLVMIFLDRVGKRKWHIALKLPLWLAGIAAGMYAAEFLKTDYGALGVMCIVTIFIFRRQRLAQVIAGAVVFLWEIPASLAFLPVAAYNGKRGWRMKYVFYAFYPCHLLVLYGIAWMLNLT